MAVRLEEASKTVDTMQHVVARQSVTRQTKTLHGIKGEIARTVQEPCDTNSYVGRRQKCHSSAAHDIELFLNSLLTNMVCNLDGDREHVGIVSGRMTGSNMVEVPVSWFVDPPELVLGRLSRVVSIFSGEENFAVVVPATPSGTQDPRQALESVPAE